MTWDVICVGTGLTSLTFATLYQQRHPGRKALLLEKHAIPGGYATEFQRPKTQSGFDCSLHKLSGMTGTGNMRRILDEMGILSDLDLVYHDELFEACSEDGDIKLPIKPENFGSALKSAFPHEHVGIDRFLADVDLYGRNAYFQFQILAGQYEPDMKALRYAHKELRKKTVEEVISEYVSDPRLKEILCAPAVYVGGLPEQLGYNYYLHIVFANLFQGTAYVTGSSQKLSDTLVDRIREGGGEVILRTPVARVLSNDQNVAIGVETQQGERFYADQVIINAAPHFALSQLFDGNAALDPVRDRVRHLKPSLATTTQYLVTDCPPAELGLECTEAMIFSRSHDECVDLRRQAAQDPGNTALQELAYWHASPMEITNYHSVDPARGHVVILNVLDMISHWPERGTREYKEKKARAMEVMTERLLARKPRIRDHIVYQEMSTPRTYERYTNNTDGAGYGALVGTDAMAHMFHYNFPIKGIHFMSSWTAGPGYEAAVGYAEFRANSWKL